MRTNPNAQSPHPAKRWLSWQGQEGRLTYYNKELEEDVPVELPFRFVLLDRLAVVRGWHDASESGITSNEVRRIMDEPMTVRAFKMKDPIAKGFYSDIKDTVKAAGGRFNTNLYIVFTDESGNSEMGSLMLHGAAMSAWFEFENDKANRPLLYTKAILIDSFTEGKKGAITFRVPVFQLVDTSQEEELDAEKYQSLLKTYLDRYFLRITPSGETVDTSPEYNQTDGSFKGAKAAMEEDDSIPF